MHALLICRSVLGVSPQNLKPPPTGFAFSPGRRRQRRRGSEESRFFQLKRLPRQRIGAAKLDEQEIGVPNDKRQYTEETFTTIPQYRDTRTSTNTFSGTDITNFFPEHMNSITSIISSISTINVLKFTFLFGLLTLCGYQQARADSDLSSTIESFNFLGGIGDISTGFASAFLLIFFSELGDKTFFIAALLASRNSGGIVFIGTFSALAAMTIISVFLGRAFHYIDGVLPFRFGETDLPIDDIAAAFLLVYFGFSTLLEAASDDGLKSKEEEEEAKLAISEFSGNGAGMLAAASTVVSTFLLVFVAEWGDKSFFSTIALAAASSPIGVIGGSLAGHAVATMIAVLGGSLLGTFFSEKAIAYIGGSLFLVFAAVTLIEIFT